MPRVSPAISNFTGGAWSPQMFGQIDMAGYQNACRTLSNMVARVHGGAQKRPGTYLVCEVKDSTKKPRLIPFQYSTVQSYCIEAGDSYMRFMKDGGIIVDGSDNPYEIGSPYSQGYLDALRWAQDKDLLYLFHGLKVPQKLTRYDHDDWEMINAPFVNGPYLPARRANELGANLQTNGGFEEDSGVTDIGSPILQERSSVRVYDGTYSRVLAGSANTQGFSMTAFTSVTSSAYVVRFRVFTRAGSLTLQVKQGSDSGTYIINEVIAEIPENEWTEISRYYTESAGGATAAIGFVSAAESLDDNKVPNPGFESAISATWYKVGTDSDTYSARSSTQKKTGTYSYMFRYDGFGARIGVRSNPFITETGKMYKVSFWVYTSQASCRMSIRRGDDSEYAQVDYDSIPDSTWTQYTYYYKETAGGASCHIMFDTNGTSSRYVDDITFQEVKTQYYIDKVEVFKADAVTITPSAAIGSGVTLTASDDIFLAGHIGAFFQLIHADTIGHCVVVGYTSAKVVTVDVIEEFGATTATPTWREGAWSAVRGYPAVGTFHEQRLMVAKSGSDPDAIWGSKTTEYEDFTPGVLATDPLAFKLQSDIINWLSPLGQLVAGTVNAEYRLGAQSSDQILKPTDVKLTPQSRKGAAFIEPVNVGNAILFIQKRGAADYGKKLRELSYNYINDSYDGVDLTLFAEHITKTGIVKMAFMSSPFPILWAVTADGYLIGMTYEREQKVIAWHIHPTDGEVEDICRIPGAEQDDIYLLVKRTINGVDKRFIEVMMPFDFGDLEDAFFVDCGLTYDGVATDALSGLDHLEGCEVAILADGKVHARKIVAAGAIGLDYPASKVHVGLPYTAELEPLDLQGGSYEGTSQGKNKRIHGVSVYFYQSMGGEIGQDADHTEKMFLKEERAADANQIPLYSGLKDDFNFQGDWQLSGRIYIKQDDPLPLTVLSILPRFSTVDR